MVTSLHCYNAAFLLFFLALAGCTPNPLRQESIKSYESGEKVRNVKEYSLTRKAVGVVEKQYAGGWGPLSIASGNGTLIRIYQSSFLIGSLDGSSHSEILIQLPDNLEIGRRYTLTAASGSRITRTDDYKNVLGNLKEGEVAAYQFGNPMSGDLNKVDLAWVKVLSIGNKTASIHLRLKAELEPTFTFDIDEQYAVGIAPQPKR